MNSQNRFASCAIASVLALCCTTAAAPKACAGDKEFGLLVHYVESHYHRHRSHRFLLGFACAVANVAARPEGVRGLKLALWENGDWTATTDTDTDFPAVVRAGLQEGWQPTVRVWSRRTGERTVVFAKPEGAEMKLLVATAEGGEAVVVQMKINPDRLSRCIDGWTDGRSHHHASDPLPPPHGSEMPGSTELGDAM